MSMEALQVRIGYHFNNKGLLERALDPLLLCK